MVSVTHTGAHGHTPLGVFEKSPTLTCRA